MSRGEEESSHDCWMSVGRSEICEIIANITLNSDVVVPIQFKCFEEYGDVEVNEILRKRFANTSKIEIDGCSVSSGSNLNNFGLQFIPNVFDILDVLRIKRFYFDVFKTDFIEKFTILRELSLENNEIDSLFVNDNANLKQVKILKLRNNKIGFLSFTAFQKLEELLWENEDSTYLKLSTVLKNIPLKSLLFNNIKLPIDLFRNLPATLIKMHVTLMKFDSTVFLQNNGVLKAIVLVDNDLPSIKLEDNIDIPTIEYMNISGNCLHEIFMRNFTQLKQLDLSRNRFSVLEEESFQDMRNLELLLLYENNLHTIDFNMFNETLRSLRFIDVSHNNLKKIGIDDDIELIKHFKIKVDGNDLKCEWLQEFFLDRPEKFQIFSYKKYTSKLNINGLECSTNCVNVTEDVVATTKKPHPYNVQQLAVESLGKKNQRAEAFIIIIMLPVGVAFLSILLFLWIRCQKIFHGSFYRNLPIIGGSSSRFVPSVSQQNYEIPVTCGNIHHNGPGFKCSQDCTLNYQVFSAKRELYRGISGDRTSNNIHCDHFNAE